MPRIRYISRQFAKASLALIEHANRIIAEYAAQGFSLTLRQLYYQFVSRDLIPNSLRSYKNLGAVVNDGRLAGRIDWTAIVDRTRALERLSHWDSPAEIIETCAATFNYDRWDNQPTRVEVWIEKDALVGVIEPTCRDLDVAYLSCRGYTSQSEMWSSAQRFRRYVQGGQDVLVLHFGDHDPSGNDMTRDIEDRLRLFMGEDAEQFTLRRIALNMDQIEQYEPPLNPAKVTDSRAAGYIAEFGRESWELDALEPTVLADLIRRAVEGVRDERKWADRSKDQEDARAILQAISDRFDDVQRFLGQ